MSDLSEDLIEEILCRVPATSLKKLRYTCKRWNNLFNDKRFTRKHSDKAPKQFLVLMLKKSRVCLMSVNLIGVPSIKVTVEVNLLDPLSNLDQFKISYISHCDGLLLFTDKDYTKIVVWNPCTGQSSWIPPPIKRSFSYALGSYQCNKSGDNSYKILCNHRDSFGDKFQIYEINSNSWRNLDINLDCIIRFKYNPSGVSLKGKTYWFASDKKYLSIFLVSFDYTTERFERLLLPGQNHPSYENMSLSIVGEEKLSVLLQQTCTSKTEIWVTNRIDETKLVSWSKILTVNLKPRLDYWKSVSFLVDEEKKILMCSCMNSSADYNNMVYIVGEDNKVRHKDFGFGSSKPFLFNYVPSLTQIQQGKGKRKKRKRNHV